MRNASLLVEQMDLGSSLLRNVQLGRILSETEVIPRDANTHFSAQLSFPLSMKTSFPRVFWQPLPPPPHSHLETASFPHTWARDLLNLLSSLLLRGYRISGDLEIHSGILIGTTEMEAKGLCADQTKATWKAVGSQQRRVMTRSSFTAARHKRGYSLKLSFKDSSVCHLDLVGVVLSISVGAGPPLLQS